MENVVSLSELIPCSFSNFTDIKQLDDTNFLFSATDKETQKIYFIQKYPQYIIKNDAQEALDAYFTINSIKPFPTITQSDEKAQRMIPIERYCFEPEFFIAYRNNNQKTLSSSINEISKEKRIGILLEIIDFLHNLQLMSIFTVLFTLDDIFVDDDFNITFIPLIPACLPHYGENKFLYSSMIFNFITKLIHEDNHIYPDEDKTPLFYLNYIVSKFASSSPNKTFTSNPDTTISQITNSKAINSQATNSQTTNSQTTNSQAINSQTTNSQTTNFHITNSNNEGNHTSALNLRINYQDSMKHVNDVALNGEDESPIKKSQKYLLSLISQANSGDAEIQFKLAEAGINTRKYILQAVKQKHKKAQLLYGKFLIEGKLFKKNPNAGIQTIKAAADAGDAESMLHYYIYCNSDLPIRNKEKYQIYLIKALRAKYWPAYTELVKAQKGEDKTLNIERNEETFKHAIFISFTDIDTQKYIHYIKFCIDISKTKKNKQENYSLIQDKSNKNQYSNKSQDNNNLSENSQLNEYLHVLDGYEYHCNPHLFYLYGMNCYLSNKTEEAIHFLKFSAEKGNLNALHKLSQILEQRNQITSIMPLLKSASEKGNGVAKYYYYLCLQQMPSYNQDTSLLFNLLNDSINSSCPEALCFKANLLMKTDPTSAEKLLIRAVKTGYDKANFHYGLFLLNHFRKNYLPYLEYAAKTIPEAEYHIGTNSKDYLTKKKYLKSASKRGCTLASFEYGTILYSEKKYEKSISYFQKAADDRIVNSYYHMGLAYYQLEKHDQYPKYFKKASELGSAEAHIPYGICLYYGIGGEKNIQLAEKLFKDNIPNKYALYNYALLNSQVKKDNRFRFTNNDPFLFMVDKIHLDFPRSLLVAGTHFLNIGDRNQAFSYFQNAASLSSSDGQILLGYCYEHSIGCDLNYNKAISLYQLAYKNGNIKGLFCESILKINCEKEDGEKLLKESADQGYVESQYHYGIYLTNGFKLIKKNYEKGLKYLEMAVEQNHCNAEEFLARCLLKGNQQDGERAIKLLKSAISKGNTQACNNLGYCYKKGLFVPQSHQKAADLFKSAADRHNFMACLHYGMCLIKGRGVEINTQLGHYYIGNAKSKSIPRSYYVLALYDFQTQNSFNGIISKGFDNLRIAASLGYKKAQYLLSMINQYSTEL